MSPDKLKLLTNFMRIADAGSLSSASDLLRIAQPALSRQMRLLEDELGTPLFTRHSRGLKLTRAGEELRDGIIGPLRQLDKAVSDVQDQSGSNAHVVFGMPPTVSYVLARGLARQVAVQAPNMSLRIVEGYSGHLVNWLHRGELDACILYGPASHYHLAGQDLLSEDIVVVGSAKSGLDPDEPISFEEFSDLPLVAPSKPHGLRILMESAAAKARTVLNTRFEADSFAVLKDLVESDLGYTALPISGVARELADGRLRYTPFRDRRVVRQLILAAQSEERLARGARMLLRLVYQEISQLVESGQWRARLMFDPLIVDIDPDVRPYKKISNDERSR